MTRQKQEVSIKYCWNIQTGLALHFWATQSQKSLNFTQNRQIVYFAEILWKLNTHSSEEHSGVIYFPLPLQIHQDNILVYSYGFPKQALEACFRFYRYTKNHFLLQACQVCKIWLQACLIMLPHQFLWPIFLLRTWYQSHSSGENMTTLLKICRYFTDHIRIPP